MDSVTEPCPISNGAFTYNPGPFSDFGVFAADDADVEEEVGPGLGLILLQPHRLGRWKSTICVNGHTLLRTVIPTGTIIRFPIRDSGN